MVPVKNQTDGSCALNPITTVPPFYDGDTRIGIGSDVINITQLTLSYGAPASVNAVQWRPMTYDRPELQTQNYATSGSQSEGNFVKSRFDFYNFNAVIPGDHNDMEALYISGLQPLGSFTFMTRIGLEKPPKGSVGISNAILTGVYRKGSSFIRNYFQLKYVRLLRLYRVWHHVVALLSVCPYNLTSSFSHPP